MAEDKNTLTNKELAEKLMYWVKKLTASGGRDWTLRVPVDENHDPDCIMTEAARRLMEKDTVIVHHDNICIVSLDSSEQNDIGQM
jgi:hypothetical protein